MGALGCVGRTLIKKLLEMPEYAGVELDIAAGRDRLSENLAIAPSCMEAGEPAESPRAPGNSSSDALMF